MKAIRPVCRLALIAAVFSMAHDPSSAAPSAPSYSVHDLGTLRGGFQTVASGINNDGVVSGSASTGLSRDMEGPYHPFLFVHGRVEDLGLAPGQIWGSAGRINDRNQFVCYQYVELGGKATPFLYSDGRFHNLYELFGNSNALPATINNRGGFVGSEFVSATRQWVAFVYTNGVLTQLATLVPGAGSFAIDINDAGVIVGYANLNATFERPFRAVMFADGQAIDLGVVPGLESSSASRINQRGHILGNSISFTTERSRGFLYRDGQMVDIGVLPGDTDCVAIDFNNSDEIVGTSYHISGGGYVFHPVLYNADGVWDLQTLIPGRSEWVFQAAAGINDRGQILLVGQRDFGPQRTLLLTPHSPGGASPGLRR